MTQPADASDPHATLRRPRIVSLAEGLGVVYALLGAAGSTWLSRTWGWWAALVGIGTIAVLLTPSWLSRQRAHGGRHALLLLHVCFMFVFSGACCCVVPKPLEALSRHRYPYPYRGATSLALLVIALASIWVVMRLAQNPQVREWYRAGRPKSW